MKTIWFKQLGPFYLPTHFAGYIITILAIVFLIPVCKTIIDGGQSVGDDLHQIFTYTTCCAFWWKWIAEKTSN